MTRPDACDQCTVGAVSGHGRGSFCPLIRRDHAQGTTLYRQGDDASYIWFVESGEVELERANGSAVRHERISSGNFVGLESLVRTRYDATARMVTDGTLCGATREGFDDWLGPRSDRTCVIVQALLRARTTSSDHPPQEPS